MYSVIISANLNPIKYFYGESCHIVIVHFQRIPAGGDIGHCSERVMQTVLNRGRQRVTGAVLHVWSNNCQRFPYLQQDFSALSCIFGNSRIIML